MNDFLKVFVSLSLSGTLLMLVVFFCKYLLRKKISKQWQYYIWLIVIARLLLPFTFETNLVGNWFQFAEQAAATQENTTTASRQNNITLQPDRSENITDQLPTILDEPNTILISFSLKNILLIIQRNLWLVWLFVSVILLVRKITIYQSFVKYIKAGRIEVSDTALLDRLAEIGRQINVEIPVELYTNDLISSPLLLGFFRPCIVLPTLDLPETDFQYTILHELLHHKRRDMFYKWLVQITVCLHWFNPFVYWMGLKISRECELSCDESIIHNLDIRARRNYGNTLLNAFGRGGNYQNSIAAVTLNESKELLNERLKSIIQYNKATKFATAMASVITVTLLCGASFIGAYSNTPNLLITPSAVQNITKPESTMLLSIKPKVLPVLQMLLADYENNNLQTTAYHQIPAYCKLPTVLTVSDFLLEQNDDQLQATIPIDRGLQMVIIITKTGQDYQASGARFNIAAGSFMAKSITKGLSITQTYLLLNSGSKEEDILTLPLSKLQKNAILLEAMANLDNRGFAALGYVSLTDMNGSSNAYVYPGETYLGWQPIYTKAVGIPNDSYLLDVESLSAVFEGEAVLTGSFRKENDMLIFSVSEGSRNLMPTNSIAPSNEIIIENTAEILQSVAPFLNGQPVEILISDFSIRYSCDLRLGASENAQAKSPIITQRAKYVIS